MPEYYLIWRRESRSGIADIMLKQAHCFCGLAHAFVLNFDRRMICVISARDHRCGNKIRRCREKYQAATDETRYPLCD
jgi:hypothetical protein